MNINDKEKEIASLIPSDLKKTKARIKILTILKDSDKPMTAVDIHTLLIKADENTNLSTVYRILDAFAERNVLTKTHYSDDSTAYYSLRNPEENEMNSVVCLSCKKRFFLKGAVVDEQSLEKKMDGFHITAHKMELYGYCKECAEKHSHGDSK